MFTAVRRTSSVTLVAVVAELAIGLGLLALAALHAADGAPGAVVPSIHKQGLLECWLV